MLAGLIFEIHFHRNLMQEGAPKGTRIAHVGIALESIASQLPFYTAVLGMPEAEVSNSDGAVIRAVAAGESLVELLEPDGADTPVGAGPHARHGPAPAATRPDRHVRASAHN